MTPGPGEGGEIRMEKASPQCSIEHCPLPFSCSKSKVCSSVGIQDAECGIVTLQCAPEVEGVGSSVAVKTDLKMTSQF